MTNRQWLLTRMQNMSDEELIKHFSCDEMEGNICRKGVRCSVCKIEWLKAEHKEKTKLSDAERIILENIDKDFKWIVRRKEGNLLVFKIKPNKNQVIWGGPIQAYEYLIFPHLFQFVKWEDAEPYNIEELLKK